MTSKEIDKKIVQAWLQGNYSIADLRVLQEYLHDPAYRESLDRFLQEEWGEMPDNFQPPIPDLDLQYEKFRSQLPPKEGPQTPERRLPVMRRLPMMRWVPVIAAAVVIFLVGMVWLFYRPAKSGKSDPNLLWVIQNTAPGEKKTVRLPDSSVVYLGGGSTLRYAADYNTHHRNILLEGEAYFVVRHDGHFPFTVRTGNLSTVDIGTEFNIRHYPGEAEVEVTVAQGRVSVQAVTKEKEDRIADLVQGQRLLYDSVRSRAVTVPLSDASLVGAWRKGILVFRKQPLKEVTDELQRYYGVSIRYTNPASATILLTTLLDNRSLEEALEIVTVTAGIHYVRQGDTVYLK